MRNMYFVLSPSDYQQYNEMGEAEGMVFLEDFDSINAHTVEEAFDRYEELVQCEGGLPDKEFMLIEVRPMVSATFLVDTKPKFTNLGPDSCR